MKIQKLIHHKITKAIKQFSMFSRKDKILIALSGGKDSLSLAHSLKFLNYSIECLLIDLGIPQISEKSKIKALKFCNSYEIPLHIISSKNLENITLPEVAEIYYSKACAACGSIKRKMLNDFALNHGFSILATGHHLEDEAVALFANNMRWDFSYLKKSFPMLEQKQSFVKRVKPLALCHEQEIQNYAQEHHFDPMSDPCPYSLQGTRSKYREIFKTIEKFFPNFTEEYYVNFLKQKDFIEQYQEEDLQLKPCLNCGDLTVSDFCRVCLIKNKAWKR